MRLTGFRLPVERLSYSALSVAIQCPEQFRRKYVLKQRERMWVDRFVGIVDHLIWEEYFQIPDRGDRSEFDFDAKYRKAWDDTLDDVGDDVDWKDEEPASVFERGLRMLKAYEPVASNLNPISIEEWIDLEIPGVPVPVVGKIDIRTEYGIKDRKTDKKRTTKPKPKWAFQARIYQLAYPLPYEIHVITKQVTPQVVTAQEAPDLLLPVYNADTTVRVIQRTVERLNDLYCRYGKDTEWPTEGTLHEFLCAYCGFGPRYAASCSAWQES